jgi:hypothetical protein
MVKGAGNHLVENSVFSKSGIIMEKIREMRVAETN